MKILDFKISLVKTYFQFKLWDMDAHGKLLNLHHVGASFEIPDFIRFQSPGNQFLFSDPVQRVMCMYTWVYF